MPTAAEYSQAVLRAALTCGDEVDDLIDQEMLGKPNVDWSYVLCQLVKVQCGYYILTIKDYVSDASLKLYYDLLGIAGSNYSDGISTDPYAQLPDITIVNGGGSGGDYTPPEPRRLPILAGSNIPFVYSYTGDFTVQYAYLEQDLGGGLYINAPNIELSQQGNTFTVTAPSDGSNKFLDNYRLTLVLA